MPTKSRPWSVGELAFYQCPLSNCAIIPSTVKSIGDRAFGFTYEDSYKKIYDNFGIIGCGTKGAAKSYADKYDFRYVNAYNFDMSYPDYGTILYTYDESTDKLTVLQDTVDPYDYPARLELAELYKGAKSIEFKGNIKEILWSSVDDYNNLESVTLNEGIKGIGAYAFCNCPKLKSVTIPDSITSIGLYAFGCIVDEEADTQKNMNGFVIKSGCMNGAVHVFLNSCADDGYGNKLVWKKLTNQTRAPLPRRQPTPQLVKRCISAPTARKQLRPKPLPNFRRKQTRLQLKQRSLRLNLPS